MQLRHCTYSSPSLLLCNHYSNKVFTCRLWQIKFVCGQPTRDGCNMRPAFCMTIFQARTLHAVLLHVHMSLVSSSGRILSAAMVALLHGQRAMRSCGSTSSPLSNSS